MNATTENNSIMNAVTVKTFDDLSYDEIYNLS